MKMILGLLALFLLAACGTHQPMSQAEWSQARSKVYADTDQAQVLEATRRMFLLSDADDFQISYPTESSIIGKRHALVFALIAAAEADFVFSVDTSALDNGTRVDLQVTSDSSGYSAFVSRSSSHIYDEPAIYDLFWARLDYLLGQSNQWVSCQDMKARIDAGAVKGTINPLCLEASDLKPG